MDNLDNQNFLLGCYTKHLVFLGAILGDFGCERISAGTYHMVFSPLREKSLGIRKKEEKNSTDQRLKTIQLPFPLELYFPLLHER